MSVRVCVTIVDSNAGPTTSVPGRREVTKGHQKGMPFLYHVSHGTVT